MKLQNSALDRSSRSCAVTAVAAAALFAVVQSSSAAIIVNDNFDSYANQAAFDAAWAPIGSVAPLSGELSTAQASSPTNSIRNPGTATNSQSRNRLTFAESGAAAVGTSLVFSFDYYDSSATAAPSRNYVNLQDTTAPGSTNQLLSLGLNNNQTNANSGGNYYMARILGYTVPTIDPDGGANESVTGSGIYFKLNDFATSPVRSAGWHNLKVVISTDDGASTDYAFYVDNILAETVSNVGTAASLRSFDNIALGSGLSNGNNEVFFDNVSFATVVPEPVSLSIATAGLMLLRRRSRS